MDAEAPRSAGDGYGTFGNLHQAYDAARPGMPEEVLDDMLCYARSSGPLVLDVGCGTGIVTRQLAARGITVVGTDVDERMVANARGHDDGIAYQVAPTEALPFTDASFGLVTAFSAFHWFANERALAEIQRVLRPRGVFCAANRDQDRAWRARYRSVLARHVEGALPNVKKGFRPETLLRQAGFMGVTRTRYHHEERLTVAAFLAYVQTTSLWNLVPSGEREAALADLSAYAGSRLEDGLVVRPVTVTLVCGRKND